MQLIVRYPDARCIVRGLEKGKAEIAEPVPVLARLELPLPVADHA
jgi:hypothetical protein